MKKIIVYILLFWGYFNSFSQTIIARQGFEFDESWGATFSKPSCASGDSVWDYRTNLAGLSASEGEWFWGVRDLDGVCGSSGFESIFLPNVNVSAYQNVIFTFDYFAVGFDNNDDLKYELFFDNISQGEIVVIDGNNSNSDNTNGWVTESVSIPSSVINVRAILSARNNNRTDRGGFDNIRLVSSPVSNGGCSTPTSLTVGSNNTENVVTGTNEGATNSGELPTPSCGNYNNGRDVWYTAQVPASGSMTVETVNSNIDPVIAIYTGTCGNLTQIDCNDEINYPESLEAKVQVSLPANTTVLIRVYAYNNQSTGNFNIVAYETTSTTNNGCTSASTLAVGNSNTENVVTGTNLGAGSSSGVATPSCGNYAGRDVWYSAQVPSSGILTVETSNAGDNIDTAIAIYTGNCGNLTEIACNDDIDYSGGNTYSRINLTNQANTTVYIRVWSYNNQTVGNFNIVAFSPECPLSTTWNGSSWSNGTPNDFTSVTINGTYNTNNNGDFESCNCTISSGATLNVNSNNYILVDNNLTVNGTLNIQHQGSLVMIQNDGTVSGSGITNVYKNSTPYNQYDYMYWSSPTSNETTGSALSGSNPNNIYRYNNINGWQNVGGSTAMTPGVGFIAEGDTNGPFPKTQTVNFNGTVNTGTITTSVNTNGFEGFDWNLIGNPYPSAIDANTFLNLNSTSINGTIYLWTHNTQISQETLGVNKYNYSKNDYASYTIGTGGVAAVSGGSVPNGFIASGQGFFVQAQNTGIVTFNNAMRVKNNNNQLFRNSKKSTKKVEKDRIWLELKNDKGAFSQILIGFLPKATDGVDALYDGKKLDTDNYVSFYSIIENKNFAIQGKKPLQEEDNVKIGFVSNININDSLKISIEKIEGQLRDYSVYLKDNLLNIIHDLKTSDYNFIMNEKGAFNERFELQFKKASSVVLSSEDELLNKEELILSIQDNNLEVRTNNGTIINDFKAYDILGRLLVNEKPSSNTFNVNISVNTGTVLLIDTILESNKRITKKFLVQ